MKLPRYLLVYFSAVGMLMAGSAFAACTSPAGTAGDQMYNTTYNVMQFCNGTNWVNMGTGGSGGVGTLTNGDFCNTDGTVVNCTTANISLTSQVTGTLQAAQEPAHTGDVTNSAGSLALSIAAAHVTNAMLAGSIAASKLVGTDIATVGTITAGTWNGTAINLASYVTGTLPVGNGGTGAASFTTNGVLYGNTASAIQVTAQGGANTILTANSGAPSWSASPTIGTSVTSPLLIGGAAGNDTLTLESTSSGTHASDAIIFKTGAQAEVARINTSGQVGIGTNNPGKMLVVNVPSGGTSGNGGISLLGAGTSYGMLRVTNTGGDAWFGAEDSTGTGTGTVTSGLAYAAMAGSVGSTAFQLITNSAARVTIDTSGNVGIGTTNPGQKFSVIGAVASGEVSGSDTDGRVALGWNSGSHSAGLSSYRAGYQALRIDGSPVVFNTVSGGNVGIGTTNPIYKLVSNNTAGGGIGVYGNDASGSGYGGYFTGYYGAYVSGGGYHAYLGHPSGYALHSDNGIVYAAGGFQPSDRRLKDDIESMDKQRALDALLKLRPVSFKWKPDAGEAKLFKDTQYGLIAQEVEPILPSLIMSIDSPKNMEGKPNLNERLGRTYSINYAAMGPWLLAGLQQLKTMFDGDHDMVMKLKADNDNLRKEFEAYKAARP